MYYPLTFVAAPSKVGNNINLQTEIYAIEKLKVFRQKKVLSDFGHSSE